MDIARLPIRDRIGDKIQVTIESFGYLHGKPPAAHILIDLRTALRDPHTSPEMRDLTGLEPTVRAHVLSTPGADLIVRGIAATVLGMLPAYDAQDLRIDVVIGCKGGKHRAPAIANEVFHLLAQQGVGVDIEHRDIDKPVVRRPELGGA
jgi:RNase adaptor protein for sRNA GlmZ degradation